VPNATLAEDVQGEVLSEAREIHDFARVFALDELD
jgi:hypothetical protein